MAHGSLEFDSSPVSITGFVILLLHLLSAYFLKTLWWHVLSLNDTCFYTFGMIRSEPLTP